MSGIGMRVWAGLALLGLGAGCVDGFKGSNVQIDFAPAMPTQVDDGVTPGPDELPANIHFTLYGIKTDAATGDNSLFALTDFEVHPLVDPSSPCFIDVPPEVEYPGIHVTQYAARVAQDTGITDVANPPANATEAQKIEAATADQRELDVAALVAVKAITSASTRLYAGVSTACAGAPGDDPTLFPPPACFDDASNARRLTMCQAAWAADPGIYEGTDRVISQPIAGTEFGLAIGVNPINGGSLVGGSEWFLAEALSDVASYALYWQYDDADGDGFPDFPPGTPAADETVLGTLLLAGTPDLLTRGVEHVHMTDPASTLTADMAVFPNLADSGESF